MSTPIPLVPTMLTIPELANRTHISKYHIRQLCTNNKISYIRTGKKYLINYEKFLAYLNGESL